jgi:uncharacterized protein YjbI with pentapeptide repeats
MKQSELKRVLNQHKLWLDSNGDQGKRADLTGANLTGANLTRAYLIRANLTGADLVGSILNSLWMNRAKVNQSQLSWLATDPSFCDWVNRLIICS